MLNGLDLFSGIGGIARALMPWVRPVAYCETDPFCQSVLLSRMASGDLPIAPIWDDVRTLEPRQFHGKVDIITAGFPCQDISVAGPGRGLEGRRSGLFFEVIRVAKEVKPTFLFLENVPAIFSRGLDTVVREVSALGYDCRWTVVSAQDVGAPHLRRRWWCLAADTNRVGLEEPETKHGPIRDQKSQPRTRGWWSRESGICRVVDGSALRVDRVKALGNAVVPDCAEEAFRRLIGLHHDGRE